MGKRLGGLVTFGGGGGSPSGDTSVEFTGITAADFINDMGINIWTFSPELVGLTSMVIPGITSLMNVVDIEMTEDLEVISFPNMTTMADSEYETFNVINNAALEEVLLESLTTSKRLWISDNPLLTTLSLPVVTSITGSFEGFKFTNNDAMTAISLPSLVTCTGTTSFEITGNLLLASISLPALTTVANTVTISSNPALTTLSFPSLTTTGNTFTLTGNALSAASVNAILAKLKALNFTGTVNMSGGTSSAPTGQGITDKADLITGGATVTTN